MGYEIKRGDLEPPLEAQLLQADGMPVDLTTAVQVRALVRLADDPGAAPIVDRPVDVENPAQGRVKIVWEAGETDTAGPCQLEFEIEWDGARPQTCPSNGFYDFPINADLG